jgi:hypothetical protein
VSLPLTTASPEDVAHYIARCSGYRARVVLPILEMTDAQVDVGDERGWFGQIHVQVGVGYACVVEEIGYPDGTDFRFASMRYDAKDIISDLKRFLSPEKGESDESS